MEEELAIGIDLGTTYSCLEVLRNGKVEIIPNEQGQNLTPSIVSFVDEDKGILVGEDALNQLITNPKRTIYSIKRLIGRNFLDEEVQHDIKSNFWPFNVVKGGKTGERPVIEMYDKNNKLNTYFPEDISKFILQKLVQSARNYLDRPIKKAVITVPAYFNDAQKKLLNSPQSKLV